MTERLFVRLPPETLLTVRCGHGESRQARLPAPFDVVAVGSRGTQCRKLCYVLGEAQLSHLLDGRKRPGTRGQQGKQQVNGSLADQQYADSGVLRGSSRICRLKIPDGPLLQAQGKRPRKLRPSSLECSLLFR